MPTETGTAFLVDPKGTAPKSLTAEEYYKLSFLVEILRSEHTKVAAEAIDWMLSSVNKYNANSPDELLKQIIYNFVNEAVQDRCGEEDVDGVLAGHRRSSQVHWLTEAERETLENTLAVLRGNGWFGDWLSIQCRTIASGKHPADRFPEPLAIAGTLADWIKEHEDRVDAARELVAMRPDLLFPAPAQPQAAPEPPAAEETSEPTGEQPAKPQRTRKRKAAARA